ncbi:MAG: hypothetical protein KGS60_06875 [Verrucomicrobia bacterium]|jgi:hypothetical protein|nr:hypothetical protein [Verrucomicrobiota bacterium]
MNAARSFPAFRLHPALLACLCPMVLAGCAGYQLGAVKPSAYAKIEKIHVPTFKNSTLEPRLAVLVTNAVISALQQDGTYKISTKEEADAVLVGNIRQIRRAQQRSTQTEVLQSRELLETMQISFQLSDPVTGRNLADVNPFGDDPVAGMNGTGQRTRYGEVSGQTSLFLDRNFQLSERQALAIAAQDAAEQIVAQLTEGW